MGKRTVSCKFPVARIKKIMQADEDVGKVAQATPILVCECEDAQTTNARRSVCGWRQKSEALEQFLQSLVEATLVETQAQGSRKMTAFHLKRTIHQNETFDFLKDIVERVEDPVEPEAGSSSSGIAGRRGSRPGGGVSGSEPRAKRRKAEDGNGAEAENAGPVAASIGAHEAAARWAAAGPVEGSSSWPAAPNPQLTPFLAGPVRRYDEEEEEDSDE